MQSLLAVKQDEAAVAVKELFLRHNTGPAMGANTEFIVGAGSLAEFTAAEPAEYIDASADNVIAEFVLDSSMDEGIVIHVCPHV